MTDDLDLRMLHRHHEPDPQFRAALRKRLLAELDGDPLPALPDDHEGNLIMLDEDGTTTKRSDRRRTRLLVAAVAAAAAVIAVGLVVRSSDEADVASSAAPPAFEDDFDDNAAEWTVGVEPGIDVRTGGGQQVWSLSVPGLSTIQRPTAFREELVDMEITAEVISMSPGATLGLLCRKGAIASLDDFYGFRLGPDGVSIVLLGGRVDGPAETLASAPFEVPDGPFTMTARCVDRGADVDLVLLVDDVEVVRTTDTQPLPAGVIGLEVSASPDGPIEIVLDRLEMRPVG